MGTGFVAVATLRDMRRRGMTVFVGALFVVALTALVWQAPVPYVQLEPGPTFNTLGQDHDKDVIVINGAPTTTSTGELRFLTVGVVSQLTLLEAIEGWFNDDDAVVPRELIYPPDQTEEQITKQQADDFANSQSAAEAAALTKLGYAMRISVKEVSAGSPAEGKLQAGDVITAVDGTSVGAATDTLLSLIRDKPVGTTLTIDVQRGGTAMTVQVVTAAGENNVPRVGFTPELTSSAPFTVDIPIEGIGGPSAGLMLALGIIDKIKSEDLTGGKIIAGTGTIDPSGKVGPIGGVPQKIIGAKNAGATIFLTPADNCKEAVANAKPGLLLVRVDTLDTALSALDTLRSGGQPTLCEGAKP
jgi:PDZ domain-containing protein